MACEDPGSPVGVEPAGPLSGTVVTQSLQEEGRVESRFASGPRPAPRSQALRPLRRVCCGRGRVPGSALRRPNAAMRTLTTSPVPEPVSEDRQSGDDVDRFAATEVTAVTATPSPIWSRPTRATATSRDRAGSAGATHGCARCWLTTSAARSTENANRRSSRCSATPSTTAASRASTEEAGSRCDRVAISADDPQPRQAPSPPTDRRGSLRPPTWAVSAPFPSARHRLPPHSTSL
jgi:hypothetical protein